MAENLQGETICRKICVHLKRAHKGKDLFFGLSLAAILLTSCGIGNGGSGGGSAGVSNEPFLTELALSAGTLVPPFNKNTTTYTATVPFLTPTTTVTAIPTDPTDTVTATVNGNVGSLTAPVSLAEGANTIDVKVTNVGGTPKVYTVSVTRQSAASFGLQAYAKASNTNAGDEFGYSVALSGDTLAVGAPFEDSNSTGINGDQSDTTAPNAGAVYVFVRSGIMWSYKDYIKASNTDGGDNFGSSVALSGDTLAVGAPFEDSNFKGIDAGHGVGQDNNFAGDSGAVYVFTRDSSGAWTQQAYVKGSDNSKNDQFGSSVSLDKDTLVVGAPTNGKVYMFNRSDTTWTQQGYFNPSGMGFGSSVSVSGDTAAVGAPLESSNAIGINGDPNNTSAPNSGAVFTFVRTGVTWSQEAYIKASNTDAHDLIGDRFGTSVALSGDTLAVGAPLEDSNARGVYPTGQNDSVQNDNSAANAGAVYVFTRDNSGWLQQAYIKASNSLAGDEFGWSVALDNEDLAVGAKTSSGNDGAAYVFIGSGSSWAEEIYLTAFNADSLDEFGYSVALDGGTLAVGAPLEDSNATGVNSSGGEADNSAADAGAVYVYQ